MMSKPKDAILDAAARLDSWMNMVTGLGTVFRDKRMSTQVGMPARLTQTDLEDLFAGNKLAKKICQAPPFHMLREWLEVTDGESNDLAQDVQGRIEELGVVSMLIEAMTLARLHGSAVVLVGADDGMDPVEPLRENNIRSLSWFTTMDRWGLHPERYYDDPLKPRYGLPEVYSLSGGDNIPGSSVQHVGKLIHESRVIRFDGELTTRRRQAQNSGWSDSVFVSMYDELRAYGHILSSTETLVTDFAQAVYKYKGLAEAIDANGEDLIKARARVIDMMRSVLGAMVLDADGEDFERKSTPLTDLPELIDRWQNVVAAVADMPTTILFGRSPAGMNATGDADIRAWYDRLSADRAIYVSPKIERLVKLLLLAKDGPTRGKEPQDWRIKWRPLWQQSEKEIVDTRKVQAEADAIYIDRGVLHESEVATSRFGGAEYSIETTLDDAMRQEDQPGLDDDDMDGLKRELIDAKEIERAKAEALYREQGEKPDAKA